MAKVKQAPREDGVGAYAMATLCCPSAEAAGGAPGLDCPWQQVAAAALCSPKLGHHHRRSHDGSYSLPLGWLI